MLAAVSLLTVAVLAAGGDYAEIPGGRFRSVLPPAPKQLEVEVKPFQLQRRPVTNADFLAFVTLHPEWRRGTQVPVFVDGSYLAHWSGPLTLGAAAAAEQPVTQVSWFAAQAYCEAQGARLPSWYEWEFAGAASGSRADARQDPAWRQNILDWYSQPAHRLLAEVQKSEANVYGVYDLHGLVWEWVDDAGALIVSGDNREQGDPDSDKFCGSGALTMQQKENYAVLMRIALLSSLQARDTTRSLGFRCARDLSKP